MNNILLITSSPRGDASHSKNIASQFVEKFKSTHPDAVVMTRDLVQNPVPHIDGSFIHAVFTPEGDRNDAQRDTLKLSDTLIEEVLWADVIVIASGLINFGVSSTLKAWVDHVVRAGKTFSYSEAGPEGLVHGKKVYLVASSGGVYSSGPMAAYNHHDTYLKAALGFIGLQDVESILVEGVAYGPEATEAALKDASERIESLMTA